MRRGAAIWLLFIFLANALMVSGNGGADQARSGAHGRDTSRATTLIYNVYDLQNMSMDLKGAYELANDIEASATKNWNNGAGFAPVGNYTNLFNGTLDGKGYNITGLFINRSTTDDVGLFGYAGKNNSVKNIGVIDVNVTGRDNVGGLFGENYYGSVNNSYVSGTVSGDHITGGLVGDIRGAGTVNNSYATGNVTGTNYTGGLVGFIWSGGMVNNSYATGNVTGTNITGGLAGISTYTVVINSYATGNVTGTNYIGGLVGYFDFSTVNNSYATGNVNGNIEVGGLVGCNNYGAVANSHATGNVNGNDSVGGLAGDISPGGTVNNSYATGNVTGTDQDIGGLAGYSSGTISNSYATGNVTGIGDNADEVGGLVGGINTVGTVENSYATGNVTGGGVVGGLVGSLSRGGAVNNSYATGYVNGTGDVGGLVGDILSGKVSNSHATGNVNGQWGVGGLVGTATIEGGRDALGEGMIINSYATGNVNGNWSVGGLAGYSFYRAVINSHATGNVNGSSDVGGLVGETRFGPVNKSYATGNVNGMNYTGGLVGFSLSDVITSFATGNVTGINYTGGLVGCNDHDVDNSYAWGYVNGTAQYVGGLVGYNEYGKLSNSYSAGNVAGTENDIGGLVGFTENGTVSNCFWDNETSGQSSSFGGTGKTTAGMKTCSTFTNAGWDFKNVWFMLENETYPVFQWQDVMYPIADAGIDQTVDEDTVVAFDGSGSIDPIGIANYTWSFRDGISRTIYGVRPAHRFSDPGIFNVTLKVTNVLGNWSHDTMTVTVNDITPPVSNSGPDQIVDEGILVTFNGSGSFDNVGIVNYTWMFNDGTGDIRLYGAGPSHIFNVPGVYAVRLNVTDARGNWAIDMMNVTVKDVTPPAADAGPDLVVDQGTLVTFDGSASTDNVGIVNYSWKFIDGAPVTLYGVRPACRFDHPGIFVVTLNVTDAAGNRGADTMTVTVNDTTAPVAEAGPDRTVDGGTVVTFDGSASSDNVGIVNYTWTFVYGAGQTVLHGVSAQFKFVIPSVYPVNLEVSDARGLWAVDTMLLTVKDVTPPVADAGPDRTVDEGSTVTLDGRGSSDNIGIVNYTWTFDYGTERIILHGVSPSFTFDVPGVYHVQLNVSDAAGFRGEDVMTLVVRDITPPVAVAGQDQRVLDGSTVVLDGSLSTDNVAISKFYWNFTYNGKAQSLDGATVFFKFDKPGVYEVVLTVIDGAGNRGEDRVVITVVPHVKVDNGGLWGLPWMPVVLIAIAVAGLAGHVVMRKRRARKGGPSQSREEPAK